MGSVLVDGFKWFFLIFTKALIELSAAIGTVIGVPVGGGLQQVWMFFQTAFVQMYVMQQSL